MINAYDYSVEGHKELLADLTLASENGRRAVREIVNESSIYAQRHMLLYVHGQLARKIKRTPVHLDGRNQWEAETGAVGPEPWPLYHHEGTGLYRDLNPGFIYARYDRSPASVINSQRARLFSGQGGAMRFVGRDGRLYFRRRVSGQRANPFVERAYQKTRLFVGARARRIVRSLTD